MSEPTMQADTVIKLTAEIRRLEAENAKLTKNVGKWRSDFDHACKINDTLREENAALRTKLSAAREAMGKVPHLATGWTVGSIHVGHENTDHARNLCRELGGQCALAALRESKEGANG